MTRSLRPPTLRHKMNAWKRFVFGLRTKTWPNASSRIELSRWMVDVESFAMPRAYAQSSALLLNLSPTIWPWLATVLTATRESRDVERRLLLHCSTDWVQLRVSRRIF